MENCFVCQRIELIQKGENPYFVKELETGYAVIGDIQRFYGYSLFICKEHATELHELPDEFRRKFLWEMSVVAQAVYNAFPCDKLNYELLGQGGGVHMHWHIFPRRSGDNPYKGPVWRMPRREMNSEEYRPDENQLADMVAKLKAEIEKLI